MKQERTRQRHALLVGAAADLLEAEGWSALTHRGLSARSGVPLASLTYYFDGVDDLVLQAATEAARRHLERSRALVAELPHRRLSAVRAVGVVTDVLVGPVPETHQLRALYERYLRAGTTPELRALVVSWNAELLGLVREVLDRAGRPLAPARVRLLVAALDGLLVTALAEGEPDPVATAVRGAVLLLTAPMTPGPA